MDKVKKDYNNLCKFDALTNPRKMCGNPILYNYQMKNLLNCKRGDVKNYKTIEEIFNDPNEIQKLWDETIKRNRRKNNSPSAVDMYECHRINKGSIVFFKSSTAKYLYKKYEATSVLDPTAGWGGRMLGAASLGIKYTGIDTNLKLREGYDNMRKDLGLKKRNYKMMWKNCLKVDFSKIDYDLVLTSPPYINMEIYEGMKPWENDRIFYNQFLIPLMNKCYKHLKIGGHMCFNISPKMYNGLMSWDYRPCDFKEDLRQQLGKQYKTKSQDYTYIWTKTQEQVDISFEKELKEMLN